MNGSGVMEENNNIENISTNENDNKEEFKEEEKNNKYYIILIILFLLLGLASGVYLGRLLATHETIFGNPIKCTKPSVSCKCDSSPKVEETTNLITEEKQNDEVYETTNMIDPAKTSSKQSTVTRTTQLTTTPIKPGNTVIETPKELTIIFENVLLNNGSADKSIPKIKNGNSLEFNIILPKPNDYYSYTVDITNKGTVNAVVDHFITSVQSETEAKYISYLLTYSDGTPIKKGDSLMVGQTRKLKFTALYNDVAVTETDVVTNFKSVISFIQK